MVMLQVTTHWFVRRVRSECLGQFWKAGVGKFSRAPKLKRHIPALDLTVKTAEKFDRFPKFDCTVGQLTATEGVCVQ
jgi:hypothetical protein